MDRRIALLFPGQGSQQVGMGRLAAERFSQARDIFDRVDGALDAPISRLCFEGPAEQLQETRWQQPAIFACSLAIYAAWRATTPGEGEAACAAGHSLGEYSALVAANALTLEDGARLVAVRGRLMQEAANREPGSMVAILGLDREAVLAICVAVSRPGEPVVLANDNAPEQQVISGATAAVERAATEAKLRGARRAVPLKVAGAFHSPLMEPAVADLRAAVDATPIRPCAFPVIANSTCEALREPDAIRAELVRQLTAPVRWAPSLQTMATLYPDVWVDTGPGSVMAGLLTRTMPAISAHMLATTVDAPAS